MSTGANAARWLAYGDGLVTIHTLTHAGSSRQVVKYFTLPTNADLVYDGQNNGESSCFALTKMNPVIT